MNRRRKFWKFPKALSRCPTDGEEVKVGEFNGVTQQLDLSKGQGICWQDGRGPPKDRTLQQFEHSHVNLAIYASLAATASCGIIIAAVFLAINIKYRNQRYLLQQYFSYWWNGYSTISHLFRRWRWDTEHIKIGKHSPIIYSNC